MPLFLPGTWADHERKTQYVATGAMLRVSHLSLRRVCPLAGLSARGARPLARIDALAFQQASRLLVKLTSTLPPISAPPTASSDAAASSTQPQGSGAGVIVTSPASGSGELAELDPVLALNAEPPVRKRPAATRVKLTQRQKHLLSLPPEQRQRILRDHKRMLFWLSVVLLFLMYGLYMDTRAPGYILLNFQLGWYSLVDRKRDRVIRLNRRMIQLFIQSLGREDGLAHDACLCYQILLGAELLQEKRLRDASEVLIAFFQAAQRAKVSEKYISHMYSRLEAAGYEWTIAPWLEEQEAVGTPVGLRWRLAQLRKDHGATHIDTLDASVRLANALLGAQLREDAMAQRMGALQALMWRYLHFQNWDMVAAEFLVDRLADAEGLLRSVIAACNAALDLAPDMGASASSAASSASGFTAVAPTSSAAVLSSASASAGSPSGPIGKQASGAAAHAPAVPLSASQNDELRRLRGSAYLSLAHVLLEAGESRRAEEILRDGVAAASADLGASDEVTQKLVTMLVRAEAEVGKRPMTLAAAPTIDAASRKGAAG